MQYTKYMLNGKKLASMSLGCMRFPSRQLAVEIVRKSVENDVTYLDTSPCYSYSSEEENCETWVGEAICGIRDKVILSAKCSTGNGGNKIGDLDHARGFSITTADQVRFQIEQSLRRLNTDFLDIYQLWAVHIPIFFDEAFKKGGWMEGVLKAKDEGLFKHIGITGHDTSQEIKRWVDTGLFDLITIPFNILDTSRLDGLLYAQEKDVMVVAMNPLSGGLLGTTSDIIKKEFTKDDITSPAELAINYVTSFDGVSALVGVSSKEQLIDDVSIMNKPKFSQQKAYDLKNQLNDMLGKAENICTTCGYCMPCPQNINIPNLLRHRNQYLVFGFDNGLQMLRDSQISWGDEHKLNRCTKCGKCESKCSNGLPILKLFDEIRELIK